MGILNAIISGILFGGILALLSYGLNLIFGVIQVIHFFYGQCVMLGLYIIYSATVLWHIPLIYSCLIAVVAILILNVVVHLAVIQPLLKAPMINQFLALASIMIILENGALGIWGATYKAVPITLPVLSIGEIYFRTSTLIGFVGALVVVGLLYLFLNKTYTGLAIRAVFQDTEMASLVGMNPRRAYLITMAVGGALAGIVAAFFVPIYLVHPYFGGTFTVMAFVIVVLGGMGNIVGGVLAAFIIGVVTMVVSFLTIPEGGLIAAYFIYVVVILLRPQGLLGVRVRA